MSRVSQILFAGIALLIIVWLGRLCNRIRFGNITLGCVWTLLIGLLAGQIGVHIDPKISGLVKEFGLSFFIFEIGLEVGPRLFKYKTNKGCLIFLLALSVVALGGFVTFIIGKFTDVDIYTLSGIMSGAVSNTPALGAAQMAAESILGSAPETIAQGYAIAYPMGIFGVLAAVLIVLGANSNSDNSMTKAISVTGCRKNNVTKKALFSTERFIIHIVFVVGGILFGRVLGSLAFHIGRMPAPFMLGNTGGTLISAVVFSFISRGIGLKTSLTKRNTTICNIGLSFFIAAMGLSSGAGFISVFMSGGYKWMFYGAMITLIPCFLIMPIAKYCAHLSKEEVCGILTGATTNSPVFAYCEGVSLNSSEISRTYAFIYPAALFARIFISQLFVFIH